MVFHGGRAEEQLGVVLFARPNVGAITLALLFGLFSLIYGVSQIVRGVELHRTGKTLNEVLIMRPEPVPGHGGADHGAGRRRMVTTP